MKTTEASQKNLKIAHRLFESGMRLSSIIWLAGIGDQPPDAFEEFMDSCGCKTTKRLWKQLGLSMSTRELDDPECNAIAAGKLAQAGVAGFLVKADWPVPLDGGMASVTSYSHCGFGHYVSEWFYAETIDSELVDRIEKAQKAFLEGKFSEQKKAKR